MFKLQGAIKLYGWFEIDHYRDGRLIDREIIDNTTTNTGFAEVAGLINEVTNIGFKWIALDSSSTAATAADSALAAEIAVAGMSRVVSTATRVTITQTNDTAQLLHTFTATASQAVKGAGIFDTATSGGVMLARTTFTSKAMETDDTLAVTYKVKVV